ncbi:type IV secretion system DNA-binding domain-containing protein, partial [Candidatus Gribaldobacteria bacterium]|nr:type IV secretion system DNA-binding domain-containing protein [Candidatus Gribaldobacteria bacterium]
MSLFYVALPRFSKQETQQTKETIIQAIEGMEQILSRFLYLKKPNILKRFFLGEEVSRAVLEIASEVGGPDISFYIAVPDYLASGLEKNIQAVYPESLVKKVPEDYTIFEPKGKTLAASIYLNKDFFFPVQTYRTLETDPLSGIVNALSKIKPEEGSALQVVIRPCQFDIKKSAEKLLHNITQEGKSIQTALRESQRSKLMDFAADIGKAITQSPKQENQNQPQEQSEINLEAIKNKIKKPIFEVNLRILAVAEEKERAEEILSHLEETFSQYISVVNGFTAKKAKGRRLKKLIYNFTFRNFNKKERILLNLEELVSVYHLPLPHIEASHIKWASTKESAPPSEMPKPEQGINCLGKAIFRGEEKMISFASRDDRRRHFYIIGQTGVGKSSLLREMIRYDIEHGEGVAVIDPNGDLIEDTLANIPETRAEDVVVFEPFDMERPLGLNMLEWKTPEQKDFAISEMITIFSKLFPPEIIGPMFEHYMRNAMLALMADKDNPGTLVEIPRIFMDNDFMQEKLLSVEDPLVKSFWQKEWSTATGQTKSDMLGYVVSKVGRFVENEMMRNIIGQQRSSFDLGEIMDQKKI